MSILKKLLRGSAAVSTGGLSELAIRGAPLVNKALDDKDPGNASKEADERTKQADALRDAYLAERQGAGYHPDHIAPSTADFNGGSAANVYDATDPGAAREYQAALAEKGGDVHVGQLSPVAQVQSRGVSGPGAAAITGMERVQGASLNTQHADKVQAQQDNYLQALQGRAAGNAPSVAENAYASKMADVANNALGIAGQARGSDKAYARLHAQDVIADQGRKAAFESAQLRAGEMDAANAQLGSQLGNVRGQDVDVAKTAAQLQQEAALSNQRTTMGTEQFNAGAVNQQNQFNTGVQERNAEREQAASAANAGAGNARTMDEAQLRAGVDTGNVTRGQQNNQFNAGEQTTAAAANAAAANNRGDFRAGLLTGAAKDNTQAINNRYDTTTAARNANAQFNAGQTQNAAGTNQAADLTANAQEINRKAGLAGDANTAMGQGTSLQVAKISKPPTPSTTDRLIAAATTAGPALVTASDERVKENVKDVDDDAAARLAKALQVKEWQYKDDSGYDDGHTHMGVMAQDLEKDPLGKKLVRQDANGTKAVDYQGLSSLLLAAALRGKKEARR